MAKILVAEDDVAIRDLVVRALNEDGHELTVANDGGRRSMRSSARTANSTCC